MGKRTYGEKVREGNQMYGPGCCANNVDVQAERRRRGFTPPGSCHTSMYDGQYWWQQHRAYLREQRQRVH